VYYFLCLSHSVLATRCQKKESRSGLSSLSHNMTLFCCDLSIRTFVIKLEYTMYYSRLLYFFYRKITVDANETILAKKNTKKKFFKKTNTFAYQLRSNLVFSSCCVCEIYNNEKSYFTNTSVFHFKDSLGVGLVSIASRSKAKKREREMRLFSGYSHCYWV